MIIMSLSVIFNTWCQMTFRYIRIRLKEEQFRKYKVLCAIEDISMTDKTNEIVRKYIDESAQVVKVVRTDQPTL